MTATPTTPFSLARNALGRLVCTLDDGSEHLGVLPVRAFPIGAPDEGVSLVSAEGKELAWIPRLSALPAPQRADRGARAAAAGPARRPGLQPLGHAPADGGGRLGATRWQIL